MSAPADEPKKPAFDGEMSNVYAKIAQNHRQPDGPWPKMLEKVELARKWALRDLLTKRN